jgi:serine/threonine-protein kinase
VPALVPVPHRARWIQLAGQLTVLLLCTALAGATAWYLREPRSSSPSQFLIVPPGGASLTAITADRELVVSRDGRRIVYVGNNATQLFVRNMAAIEPRALPALGTPRGPFLSPNGEWVGFFDGRDSTLKKVAVSGGPPTPLGKYQGLRGGATWGDDGTILFATRGTPSAGLWTVPDGGGEPVVLTTPNPALGEANHLWPEFVPGRPAVLFTILATNGGLPAAQIAIRDLRTGAQKILLRGGTHGRYVTSGHLVYAVDGALLASPSIRRTGRSLMRHGLSCPMSLLPQPARPTSMSPRMARSFTYPPPSMRLIRPNGASSGSRATATSPIPPAPIIENRLSPVDTVPAADLNYVRWVGHCRDLVQLPGAA